MLILSNLQDSWNMRDPFPPFLGCKCADEMRNGLTNVADISNNANLGRI